MGKGIKKNAYLSVGDGGMREGIDRRGRGSWCPRLPRSSGRWYWGDFVAELIRPI